ncbi:MULTISPECIES: type I-C CRISPR-associated protein Cas5c [Jonquetella]|uniref:pre-crRNA processing endonuclease n=1 Tax=Jonquetella anthropi DSM 22815 TaxID=885272 RepID=H0UMN7_9BACT|nr:MULTISPECIES: type I-C CRISPR-associated protein Cas5c [Jonquetella]EEX49287.1 CRISPR-associated protein Cas5, Dvulg subtype [Jonquetella anthropi E3_33 E1]EHM13740.1 CRISPR-associated protein Cas5, subtype I-C/DVULG [Jonquetella anthropi DSM 22815]ERL23942.1 CRISPR-associated protein Cas5, subtype I-C/DVULG [Jonquetella sp. BV3C21]
MDFFNKSFCLEVAGDFACFTRPEMKVERVSYDVITPSAARGIFTAIFWKPAIRWIIREIHVLEPIRWLSFRRNEVGALMKLSSGGLCIEDHRQQKASILLRDVRYRLVAELEYIPPHKRPRTFLQVPDCLGDENEREIIRSGENPGKYYGIFERRARKGQHFMAPYLGCREFSCSEVRLIDHPETEKRQPIDETRDLGIMLYDLDFSRPEDPQPAFFRAKMDRGIIKVPDWESEAVLR